MYLKLRSYRMQSLAARTNQKLVARFYGSFEVLKRFGVVAYKLQLLETAKIHIVFLVSLLKRNVRPFTSSQPLPQDLSTEAELLVQPEQIPDNGKNDKGEHEVLVKWQHLPDFENSSELAARIKIVFPNSHLEDKVNLQGGVLLHTLLVTKSKDRMEILHTSNLHF